MLERDSSEALREIAESKVVRERNADGSIPDAHGPVWGRRLAWLRQNPPRSKNNPDSTANYTNGTAIFKGDRMVGVVDEAVTRGILWLRDEIVNAVITVTPKGSRGTVSAKLLRSKTRLIPHIKDGNWSMTVRIHVETAALRMPPRRIYCPAPSTSRKWRRP